MANWADRFPLLESNRTFDPVGQSVRQRDLLPAYVFGSEHASVKHDVELGSGPHVDRSMYREKIITKEIKRTISAREKSRSFGYHPGIVQPWLTEAAAANILGAYHFHSEARRRQYAEHGLMLQCVFSAISEKQEAESRRKHHGRWRALFILLSLVSGGDERAIGSYPVRLAGSNRALYELMFQAEPRKYMSRSTFLTVMRKAYGFRIAPQKGRFDQSALKILSAVYHAFDINGDGKVDWRHMLFMFRVATNAQVTVDDNLKWGFAIYSSPGSFDMACNDPVIMEDLYQLLGTLARFDRRNELIEIFERAWEAAASKENEARRMAAQIGTHGGQGQGPIKLKISMILLEVMLRDPSLLELFKPARRFGCRDRGVWTYVIEEAFYDPMLLDLVRKRRRELRNDKQIAIFQSNSEKRSYLVHLNMWKRLLGRRRRCRELMAIIGRKYYIGNTSRAFAVIRRRAICCKAVEMLQRVSRGYMGRQLSKFVRETLGKVIKTQAMVRGVHQRRLFLGWMETRCLAATRIQKIVRGGLGRRVACCLLQEYFDREMLRVDAEVERVEYRRRHEVVQKVQSLWRRRRDLRSEDAERMRLIRISEVEAEMQRVLHAQEREREVYKRELVAWFKEQREQQEASRITEEHTAKERYKILLYRRRELDRIAEEKRRRKRAAEEKFEEQRIENWQREWAERGEERAIALRNHLEAVLSNPDNAPEKALRRQLQSEIKAQSKSVLKLADIVDADLEAPEALIIAQEDVLLRKMEEERERVREEMKIAAAAYLEAEAKSKAEKEKKLSEYADSAADAAARTIQKMYHAFSATRATHKRAKEVYTKHFDTETLCYYWYNSQIHTVSWKKPLGFGAWDVDPEDRWEMIKGYHDLHYYYNPKTYVMQWNKPVDAAFCEECESQFCTRWCKRTKRALCKGCYEGQRAPCDYEFSNELSETYEVFDGAKAGAREVLAHVYFTDRSDTRECGSFKETDGEAQGGLTNGCSMAKSVVGASAGSSSPVVVDRYDVTDQATATPCSGGSAKIGMQFPQYSSAECLASGRSFKSLKETSGAPDGVLGTYEDEVHEYLESQSIFLHEAVVGKG